MISTSDHVARAGILESVLSGGRLDCDDVFRALADGDVPPAWKGAVLSALRVRGERPEELAGLARAMLAHCRGDAFASLDPQRVRVDTCGTGGDGSGSVNLSTAAALVVAALGIPVAKHGNRSVSSRAGSADCAQALGIPLSTEGDRALAALERDGFAFLFAPAFHPATAGVAAVRRELGVRTVFNLLGPLVNPARPTHQLTGTGDSPTAAVMAAALAELDVQRAFVVTGARGWDEATPVGPFVLQDVRDGHARERVVDPADYGTTRCEPEALVGGDAAENAAILLRVFAGERDARVRAVRDAVLLNAALVLELMGGELGPRAAFEHAASAIDEGRVVALLERTREVHV